MTMNKKALFILSAGHLITDLNTGALPALLPFFKGTLNLSYTTAGGILLMSHLSSSVVQPAFGYLLERYPARWFLPLSPFIAGLGMALAGFAPSYLLLLACVILSGLGTASFHPEGYRTAHWFAGEKKATGISIFSVGGNLGMAIGPLWAIGLVTYFGMKGTLAMILPGVLIGAILLFPAGWHMPSLPLIPTQQSLPSKAPPTRRTAVSLAFLVGLVIVRSWAHLGLVSYIPFYYIEFLKGDPLYAGKLVTTFLLAGALGTLVGAPIADAWGHKKFVSASLILVVPLLFIFYKVGGWMAFVIIALAGMVLVSSFSVTIVMAQNLLPQNLGLAAGLMVGFGMGTGGIGVTLLGAIADRWGVPLALQSILILPLLGLIFLGLLKYPPEEIGGGTKP